MAYKCDYTRKLSAGATVDFFSVNFTDWLDSSETISSVAITEVDTTDLTLTSKAANAAAMTVNEDTVAIGKGVQCTIDAASAKRGTTYTLKVTPTTSAGRIVPFEFDMEAV